MKSFWPRILSVTSALLLLPILASAFSTTDQVASPRCPVSQEEATINHWPDGVLDLLNDITRTNGWRTWFSECPNDTLHYEFQFQKRKDLHRVLHKFLAIRNDRLRILLVPAKEPALRSDVAATFSIGNQRTIDEWFQRLEKDDSGTRIFGVNRYKEPPVACPPTLTLFVDNKLVRLKKLRIPTSITVESGANEDYRSEHKGDPLLEAIDAFVANHKTSKNVRHP